jgi:hypothetical protein
MCAPFYYNALTLRIETPTSMRPAVQIYSFYLPTNQSLATHQSAEALTAQFRCWDTTLPNTGPASNSCVTWARVRARDLVCVLLGPVGRRTEEVGAIIGDVSISV